jgi:hypothetical protein
MLDQIREYMRRRLARISASFTFGEYTSAHLLLNCFLTSDAQVTYSTGPAVLPFWSRRGQAGAVQVLFSLHIVKSWVWTTRLHG